jgi:hypothetical protein
MEAKTNEIEPLEGKTTAEEMKFEPTRLSYLSAEAVAAEIVGKLKDVKGKTVVITGTSLLVDFTNLASASTTLDGLLEDYKALSGELVPSPLASRSLAPTMDVAAAAALTQVLGLISLFRQDVDYKGYETVVDPLSFEIVLANALKAKEAAMVIVPDLFVMGPKFLVEGGLKTKIEQVHEAKAKAWKVVARNIQPILQLEAELEEAHQASKHHEVRRISKDLSQLREEADPLTERLSQVDRRLSELETAWERVPEGQAISPLGRLLRADAILERSKGAIGKPEVDKENPTNTIFLHASVVASGGHQRISRHLLRMLFLGDGISFDAGVVARWAVLSQNGVFDQGGLCYGQKTSSFNDFSSVFTG